MTNSTFTGNTAQEAGAIYVEDGDLTLTDVTLTLNSSSYGGGGLRTRYATLSLTDVIFDQNSANSGPGGGLFLDGLGSDSDPVVVQNCSFTGNFAASDGSAINSAGQNLTIDGSIFSNNVTEGGGAIASVIVGFTMTNTLMHDNSGADGGAIMCNASNTTITNCTIVGNNDTQLSGLNSSGILVHTGNTSFTILNSIIWNNVINFDDYDGGTLNISYSDIEGGESGILLSDNNTGTLNWGEGNLNVNPLFADIDNSDFSLSGYSQLIASGSLVGAPSNDITGAIRPNPRTNPDLGALRASVAPLGQTIIMCQHRTLNGSGY